MTHFFDNLLEATLLSFMAVAVIMFFPFFGIFGVVGAFWVLGLESPVSIYAVNVGVAFVADHLLSVVRCLLLFIASYVIVKQLNPDIFERAPSPPKKVEV